MKNIIIILTLVLNFTISFGQHQTKRVLFLGNSYTYVNNLPQVIADAALSNSDTLILIAIPRWLYITGPFNKYKFIK
ncbi:MAG TPA: hypothetical protein PKK00_04265 [Bacteroidales bacterium]|nr:hypothetical protein [Bacteroidales bacterium]HPS16605.1 hypothetical protein [Bacteroidales bacterium]